MMRSALLLAITALGQLTSAGRSGSGSHKSGPTLVDGELIFHPPSNYTDPQVLYARSVQLYDGRLLATWENYSPEPPLVYFPIYESLDDGASWHELSKVEDQVNGYGLRYQPFLYQLPQAFGKFPKGTVLLSGSSIPADLSSTHIELYASTDKGRTWEFVSHIASGGVALPNNGETPVWEPFLMTYQDTLIVYYSDQRDNETYGQKLVHQETKDLVHWGDVIDDVTSPTYTDRPGMPVITKLPNGDYLIVYENGGTSVSEAYSFPVYYRIASDPRKFLEAPAHYINTTTGDIPVSSPYVVWSPVGGPQGSIIVSGGGQQPLYINRDGGNPDAWVTYNISAPAAYTRNLRILQEDPDYLMVLGAGHLPPSSTNNVTDSVYRISEILGL
ncbi:BNR/Asp-box repeat protein [Xylariales sp. AK1849]|nr:BNR/Asp-box repeat protein [Xylariales sp. AK1849]